MLTILSLGAGVQSSTLALMAARGELTPMPDCAIFADTQSEPASVYKYLDWIESQLPFPVYRVTAGSLREQVIGGINGTAKMNGRPPFFTHGGGMLNRQCTQDFKIAPIQRKVRELLGLAKGARAPRHPVVEQWIGISTDEAGRMKPSRLPYIKHRWPLIEAGISRTDCLAWFADRGFMKPTKSACTFCPYHDDDLWREMKATDPESFADAVQVDAAIRKGMPGQRNSEQWYLHRSRLPLDKVDFRTAEDAGQIRLFDEECEGMCGV